MIEESDLKTYLSIGPHHLGIYLFDTKKYNYVYKEELMSEYIKMGMRFILPGSDLSFMMQSASQRSNKLRSFL